MWTPTLVLIAAATLGACALLGGGLYEAVVVDPAWPKRPGIIQAHNGGISRRRFWIPAHTVFEVLLIVALIAAWHDADVRLALLVALAGHALMRVWSLVDFVPEGGGLREGGSGGRRRDRRGGVDAAQPAADSTGSHHLRRVVLGAGGVWLAP
jgi:hypothetical protein